MEVLFFSFDSVQSQNSDENKLIDSNYLKYFCWHQIFIQNFKKNNPIKRNLKNC